MGKAVLNITSDLLHQLLALPATATVVRSVDSCERFVSIVVESPDLPNVELSDDGVPMQEVIPSFRRQPEVVFDSWNARIPD